MGTKDQNLPRIQAGPGFATRAEEYHARAEGRLHMGELMREVRVELVNHLGGEVSMPQSLVIDVVAIKVARLSMLSSTLFDYKTTSYANNEEFLAWSESLCRDLKMLGIDYLTHKSPTVEKILAKRRGRA